MLSHKSLVNNARLFGARKKIHQGSVYANFMPLFHTAGCATATLGSLQAGLQNVVD